MECCKNIFNGKREREGKLHFQARKNMTFYSCSLLVLIFLYKFLFIRQLFFSAFCLCHHNMPSCMKEIKKSERKEKILEEFFEQTSCAWWREVENVLEERVKIRWNSSWGQENVREEGRNIKLPWKFLLVAWHVDSSQSFRHTSQHFIL